MDTRDNLPLAIGAVVTMTLATALSDVMVKGASDGVSLWQIFALRAVFAVPVLFLIIVIFAPRALRAFNAPAAAGWLTLRSALMVLNWIAFYAALPFVPLPIAAAVYYTLPIFITIFAALLLKDPVGRGGWIAVALGFSGVLLILRPGAGAFQWAALLPLISAVAYALAMVLSRARLRGIHPFAQAGALNIGFAVAGAIGLSIVALEPSSDPWFFTFAWTPPDAALWGTFALMAVFILIGSITTAVAYQNAPPARVGPFDFAYVGFAVLFGWLFFNEVPGTLSWVGIALIVAGGITAIRAT